MPLHATGRVFLLTLAVVGGILLADRWPTERVPSPGGLYAMAALLLTLAAGAAYRLRAAAGGKPLTFLLWLAAWAIVGMARTVQTQHPRADDVSRFVGGPSIWIRAQVEGFPEVNETGRQSFTARAERRYDFQATQSVQGYLRVTCPGQVTLVPGSVVWLRGRLAEPSGATNPDAFDYRAYLQRHGIFATLTIKRADDVQPGGPSRTTLVEHAALAVRTGIRRATGTYLSPPDAALINGLLLSDRTYLPAVFTDALARVGMVHILSVSGLHVATLAATVLFCLRGLRVPRAPTALVSVAVLWLFVLASGCASAAVRSGLMATLFLLAPLVRRAPHAPHTLNVAALALLLWEPGNLWDAGFQLSVATVGALVLYGPPLLRLFFPPEPPQAHPFFLIRWAGLLPRATLLMLMTGIIAEAGSGPLVAYHFNLISRVGPLANAAVILAEVLTLLGLGLSGVQWLPPFVLRPLWQLVTLLLHVLQGWVYAFAALPFASVAVVSPPAPLVLFYYIALLGGAIALRRHVLHRTLFAPELSAPDADPSSAARGGLSAAP